MGLTQSYLDDKSKDENFDQRIYDFRTVIDNDCSNVSNSDQMISDIFVLSKCIRIFGGLDSNSASSSDIYTLKFKPNSRIPDLIMKQFISNDHSLFGVIRNEAANDMFSIIDRNTKLPTSTIIESQIYEMFVYKEKVRPLIVENICPFFVKYYGSDLNVPERKIENSLFSKISPEYLNDFYRNIYVMKLMQIKAKIFYIIYDDNYTTAGFSKIAAHILYNLEKNKNVYGEKTKELLLKQVNKKFGILKSATTKKYINRLNVVTANENNYIVNDKLVKVNINDIFTIASYNNDKKYIIFNFRKNIMIYGDTDVSVNNRFKAIIDLDNPIYSHHFIKSLNRQQFGYMLTEQISNSFSDFITSIKTLDNINMIKQLKIMMFMILIACASMYYHNFTHNDLHAGNIRCLFLPNEQDILYFIFDKSIRIDTKYIPKIYDFDRSYAFSFNNELLNKEFYIKISQANKLLDKKDFIKIVHIIIINMRSKSVPNDVIEEVTDWLASCMIEDTQNGISKREVFEEWYAFHNYLLQKETESELEPSNTPSDFDAFVDYKQMLLNMCDTLGTLDPSNIDDRYYVRGVLESDNSDYFHLSDDIFENGRISERRLDRFKLKVYNDWYQFEDSYSKNDSKDISIDLLDFESEQEKEDSVFSSAPSSPSKMSKPRYSPTMSEKLRKNPLPSISISNSD